MAENPRIIEPAKKSGWDAPLDVDWNFQVEELRKYLADYAPGRSGQLRTDLRSPGTVTINKEQTEIYIKIGPNAPSGAYARIQDEGGYVPPFDIREAEKTRNSMLMTRPYSKVMRAVIGGVARFFTKRKGFHLRGWHYVDRAVSRWWDELCGNPKATVVEWAEGEAGKTHGKIRGILSE